MPLEEARCSPMIWGWSVAAGLVAFTALTLMASSVESDLITDALLYGSVCCLYGPPAAWAIRCGGRRQTCERAHKGRAERWRCSRAHPGDYKSLLFVSALLFAPVLAIAFVNLVVAIGLVALPLGFLVLALTYRPERRL